jgi:hypothetical protein
MVKIFYGDNLLKQFDYCDKCLINIFGKQIVVSIPDKGKEIEIYHKMYISTDKNGTKLIEIFI